MNHILILYTIHIHIQARNLISLHDEEDEEGQNYDPSDADDEDDDDEEDEVDEEDEEEDNKYTSIDALIAETRQQLTDSEEGQNYDHEEEEEEDVDLPTEVVCKLLQIENTWKNLVPTSFLSLIFNATYRLQLTIDQAMLANNMYVLDNEYIHAAYQVYILQKDKVDFIDTINRVTRENTGILLYKLCVV